MVFISKNVVLFYLASVVSTLASAKESSLQSRDLTVCDTLKACYLVNIDTRTEVELESKNKLELDPDNKEGYSIRCDVNGVDELDFIKFFYDGKVQDEFGLPRYMGGDSDNGAFINKVDYISTCGVKTLKIEGDVWSNSCFEQEYVIDVFNGDGTPCDDNVKPTNAPVKPSTEAPIKPQTPAPVKPETRPPTKPITVAPVRTPVATPVRAPFTVPVTAPVLAPVLAPVRTPVAAPAKPDPVPTPVRAPVREPIRQPVPVPVIPTCPSPKVWINGVCKDPTCPYPKVWKDGSCKDPSCTYPKVWINGCCKDPTSSCPYPKQWINGSCQDTCKDNYVCPMYSFRIAHRLCYDNFDDCECKYGYYKASHDAKCIRHSWCVW